MNCLERLKLELSNKEYFTDTEYSIFLNENGIKTDLDYSPNLKVNILCAVRDILEALSNDLDRYSRIETEFANTTQALTNLTKRLQTIRARIAKLNDYGEETNNPFSFMYTGD